MRVDPRGHRVEYAAEALSIGLFMVSASVFGALLEHHASPVRHAIASPLMRRALMGLAMGATAVALIRSPWGRRSGAHMNPAVTLAFWSLGKVTGVDAISYVLAQAAGGLLGMLVAWAVLGAVLADPAVNWVVTVPGAAGTTTAFAGEAVISFLLMSVVLVVSNLPRIARLTPFAAGALVALFITFEAPVSGMSMNPARTLGSAVAGGVWTDAWVYFVAPPVAMLAAGLAYRSVLVPFGARILCAKLDHDATSPCPFTCGFMAAETAAADVAPSSDLASARRT